MQSQRQSRKSSKSPQQLVREQTLDDTGTKDDEKGSNKDMIELYPVTPEEMSRNQRLTKAANTVLAYGKMRAGRRTEGVPADQDRRERIKEEEICEQLQDLGIQPRELDSLIPPSFNQVPQRVDIETILFKTLVASKKHQKDKLRLDKAKGTIESLESPVKTSAFKSNLGGGSQGHNSSQ